jgi:hypothetical protein
VKCKSKKYALPGPWQGYLNRVHNAKDAHELWTNLYALHERTMSKREERYHIALKKINFFEMLPKESANDIYTRLNVLVEDLNVLDSLK